MGIFGLQLYGVFCAGSEIVAAQDKFLVQTHTFVDQKSIPSSTELARYWRALPPPAVREHRLVGLPCSHEL